MEFTYHLCACEKKKRLRYSDLRKEMENITNAVLAAMLKELLQDEIMIREQYQEITPHVEYYLSDKALSVVSILHSICYCVGAFHKQENELPIVQCQTYD